MWAVHIAGLLEHGSEAGNYGGTLIKVGTGDCLYIEDNGRWLICIGLLRNISEVLRGSRTEDGPG